MYVFLLDICLGVELQGQKVYVCSTSVNSAKQCV